MQITIDTETDSKERLLLVAELLQRLASSPSSSPNVKQVAEFVDDTEEETDEEDSEKPVLPSLGPGVQYYS